MICEVVAALGCTWAEWDALSPEDQGDLIIELWDMQEAA